MFRIIIGPAQLLGNAVARSTQTLGRTLARLWRPELKRSFFIVGFFLGVALFVATNIYAYHVAEPPCCDFSIAFGFPFPLGRTGGFAGGTHFILLGVFLNSVVGLLASIMLACLFAKLLPPLVDLFRQAGQWHMNTRS